MDNLPYYAGLDPYMHFAVMMTKLHTLIRKLLVAMKRRQLLSMLIICAGIVPAGVAQQFIATGPPLASAPNPHPGTISGTVIDVNDEIVPGATVLLEDPIRHEHRTVVANDNGAFEFDNLKPGTNYHVAISANGVVTWTSLAVIVNPGQFVILSDARLEIAAAETSITVYASSEQIAEKQVRIEEHQRVLGVIPNFL